MYLSVIARFLATAGGVGYSPISPGTCGTAVAVPLVWLTATWPVWGFATLIVVVTGAGIWAAGVADKHWETHDSGRIVIDEVAGYLVTMAVVDRADWVLILAGFVLFRFFDIAKPPPVRWLDKHMSGGTGVVLDDIAAGVLAGAALYGLSLTTLPAKIASFL